MRALLILNTLILFTLGLVMIFSTTSAEILDHDLNKNMHYALIKQTISAGVGLILSFLVWRLGYRRLITYSPYLLAFFTFLLVLVLIPGIGHTVNGSKRWFSVAGFSFQPSEFVKFLLPIYFIYYLMKINYKMTFNHFLKLIGFLALPLLLIMVEPNNGTAFAIGITLAILCFLTAIPFNYWAWPLLILISIGGIFATQLPYVSGRLKTYMHPELDRKGRGHQPYQAKIAAGSGQLFGRGPGNSLQKLSYLPEAQNDYIAAIYAEEFGFIGMLILITLYASLGLIGFSIAMQFKEQEGFYLATMTTFVICFQAFLNLAVVSGLLPSTGLNLPLFSQGGSSLMANSCAIALLLNLASIKQDKLLCKNRACPS